MRVGLVEDGAVSSAGRGVREERRSGHSSIARERVLSKMGR